jgi:hypothetical protein
MRRSLPLLLVALAGLAFVSNVDAAPKRKRSAPKGASVKGAPAAPAPAAAAVADAPPAPAAPAAPKALRDELPREALHDWDAARELYEAKDFEGAAVEFQRAYEISKNPRVLFNVAICQKNLAHYARAVALLRRELREGGASLADAEQARVRDAIETIQTFVTGLELTVSEPNATVAIDGRELDERTPFAAPIPIEVGIHTLTIRKQGFHERTITVQASAKVNTAPPAVVLEPLVRRGIVAARVSGAPLARVIVDGVEMGFAPYTGEFVVGRHTVEARAVGHVTASTTVELGVDQRLPVDLELRPEKHEGRVRLEAVPAGSALFLDGKALGADSWEGVLSSGGHQVVARRDGFEPLATEVNVADDQTRTIRMELQPRRGRNDWIWWSLGSAAVLGASAYVGYTLTKPTVIDPQPGTLNPGIRITQ